MILLITLSEYTSTFRDEDLPELFKDPVRTAQ